MGFVFFHEVFFFIFYQKTECEIDCVCYLYVFKWIPYGNDVKYEPGKQYIHYITGRIYEQQQQNVAKKKKKKKLKKKNPRLQTE